MSRSEETESLLSQLVDGELPIDQANEALAGVLDELGEAVNETNAAGRLHAMLQMRRALAPWRRLEPARAVLAAPPAKHRLAGPHATWRLASLAAAVMLGGVLVAAGIYLGSRQGATSREETAARQPAIVVTPEERRNIARAFALHESVVGPLNWYAADETTIQVAPAEDGEPLRAPIAVVLQLADDDAGSMPSRPKTYVIVFRGTEPAAIELPPSAVAERVRLRLLPTVSNGEVSLHYAIAADRAGGGPGEAALAGRRHVGLGQTALGQLALNDRLVSVGASAWVMHEPLIQ